MNNIRRVIGAEPKRDDESPQVICIGFDKVSRIVERKEDFGSYAILWFEGLDKDNNVVVKMNALHVAHVED